MNKTRVFFIVDCSGETNREIFETLQEARKWVQEVRNEAGIGLNPENEDIAIHIGMVRHAFRSGEGWNYEDRSDTFQEDKEVVIETDLYARKP